MAKPSWSTGTGEGQSKSAGVRPKWSPVWAGSTLPERECTAVLAGWGAGLGVGPQDG